MLRVARFWMLSVVAVLAVVVSGLIMPECTPRNRKASISFPPKLPKQETAVGAEEVIPKPVVEGAR